MLYYKITKEQADRLSKFEYEHNMAFDPYVGEQKDGCYLINEKLFQVLQRSTPKIQVLSKDTEVSAIINWKSVPVITQKEAMQQAKVVE